MPDNVNKAAEEAVIGSMLVDASTLHVVRPILGETGKAFYYTCNSLIYATINRMFKAGLDIDCLTVETELDRVGRLTDIGGASYLAYLLNSVITCAYAETYAKQVLDAYIAREVTCAATDIARMAHSGELTTRELQARSSDRLAVAFESLSPEWRGRILGSDVVNRIFAVQEKLAAHGNDFGLVTGIAPVDRALKPLSGGDLMFVLAPTSTGKTSIVLQGIRANAKMGRRPVFYFNELSMTRLQNRLVVMESVDWKSWEDGRTTDPLPLVTLDELEAGTAHRNPHYIDALGSLSEWIKNCTFQPAHDWTATEIATDFQSLWAQGLCDQVWIDYLDLIVHRGSRNNDSDNIGEKVQILKNGAARCKTATTDGVPIVVTGQPPKYASSDDAERRPTGNDAFGSVRPSQYSSKVLTLWRERDAAGRPTGFTILRIEKNPDGGNEGFEVLLMVAGTKRNRGYAFYPADRY